MNPDRQSFQRRSVLKVVALSTVIGGGAGGIVAGKQKADLITVDPPSLALEKGETRSVEVTIQGPPFGRTDVEVSNAPADPDAFRLSDRGESKTVELGPVDEDVTATFEATLPAGDEQTVQVEIDRLDPAAFELQDLEIEPATVEPDGSLAVEVTVGNVGDVSGETNVELSVGPVKDVQSVEVAPSEAETLEFAIAAPPEPGIYDVVVQEMATEGLIEGSLEVEEPVGSISGAVIDIDSGLAGQWTETMVEEDLEVVLEELDERISVTRAGVGDFPTVGTFKHGEIPPGEYTVTAYVEGEGTIGSPLPSEGMEDEVEITVEAGAETDGIEIEMTVVQPPEPETGIVEGSISSELGDHSPVDLLFEEDGEEIMETQVDGVSYDVEVPEGTYDVTARSWGNTNYPDVEFDGVEVHPDETTQVDIEFTWL